MDSRAGAVASSRILRVPAAGEEAEVHSRRTASSGSPPLREGPAGSAAPDAQAQGDLGDDWAFRVEDDLRVLFRWKGDACFLVALGTHDEVY